MDRKIRVGLAFQGGGFPAGALGAGVVHYLVDHHAFERYEVAVFSGTSAGALVAAVCWGHALQGTMAAAPATLAKQWLHFALGLVPNAQMAQLLQLTDSLARLNPLYSWYADQVRTPFVRRLFQDWVLTYIPVDELILLRDYSPRVPGLLLGAADVLRGEVKVFTEWDFCLDALLASGSLDEVNGITTINQGRNQGVFCDGAWGTNPPLTPMIDYGLDEIWFVEVFPKQRRTVPSTLAERKDRKDELWQNSLVEHELYHIAKVNEWLATGRLRNEDGKYRPIRVKRMPMRLDLQAGAAFVNSPAFLWQMMAYGYEQAAVFLQSSADTAAGDNSRHWLQFSITAMTLG